MTFELVEPGLVSVPFSRPDPAAGPDRFWVLAAVGRTG
jgi:hypothetical protein